MSNSNKTPKPTSHNVRLNEGAMKKGGVNPKPPSSPPPPPPKSQGSK